MQNDSLTTETFYQSMVHWIHFLNHPCYTKSQWVCKHQSGRIEEEEELQTMLRLAWTECPFNLSLDASPEVTIPMAGPLPPLEEDIVEEYTCIETTSWNRSSFLVVKLKTRRTRLGQIRSTATWRTRAS